MRLCLNMIVRNEADRIVRALKSAVPYISCYVIADTGSTDGTPDLFKDFFKAEGIPGKIVHCKFEDFSQARNVALFAAQKSEYEFDYILLFDADMELKVVDPMWLDFLKGAPSYDMVQIAGVLHYANRRFAKRGETNGYRGVTHEFIKMGRAIPEALQAQADAAQALRQAFGTD